MKERQRERERTSKLNQNVFFVIKSFNFLCRRNKYFFELRLILFSSICTKSNSPTHPTPSPSHTQPRRQSHRHWTHGNLLRWLQFDLQQQCQLWRECRDLHLYQPVEHEWHCGDHLHRHDGILDDLSQQPCEHDLLRRESHWWYL